MCVAQETDETGYSRSVFYCRILLKGGNGGVVVLLLFFFSVVVVAVVGVV